MADLYDSLFVIRFLDATADRIVSQLPACMKVCRVD
jgi:hypothetical protein